MSVVVALFCACSMLCRSYTFSPRFERAHSTTTAALERVACGDCSASCRSYATAIVELLDPSGRLFGQRIISQGAAGDGVQQDLTKRLMQVLHTPLLHHSMPTRCAIVIAMVIIYLFKSWPATYTLTAVSLRLHYLLRILGIAGLGAMTGFGTCIL